MGYITDRKRAVGMGASKTGTLHHWHMIVTSVLLVPLVPLFVFTFGTALGLPHDEALAYYSRPFPAIIAGLSILLGMVHFKNGAQSMIEDYWQGFTRKAALIGVTGLCYTLAAVGLFAIARIAL